MKKIFNIQFIVAVLLICMGSSLWAQSYEPARNKLIIIFSPLNKTQITTGILYEYDYQLIKNPVSLCLWHTDRKKAIHLILYRR